MINIRTRDDVVKYRRGSNRVMKETAFMSFVAEGPTKIFPGEQLPMKTPSLPMGCFLCLHDVCYLRSTSRKLASSCDKVMIASVLLRV